MFRAVKVSLRELRAAVSFYRSGPQSGRDKLDLPTLAKHTGQFPKLVCRDEKGKGRFAYLLKISSKNNRDTIRVPVTREQVNRWLARPVAVTLPGVAGCEHCIILWIDVLPPASPDVEVYRLMKHQIEASNRSATDEQLARIWPPWNALPPDMLPEEKRYILTASFYDRDQSARENERREHLARLQQRSWNPIKFPGVTGSIPGIPGASLAVAGLACRLPVVLAACTFAFMISVMVATKPAIESAKRRVSD